MRRSTALSVAAVFAAAVLVAPPAFAVDPDDAVTNAPVVATRDHSSIPCFQGAAGRQGRNAYFVADAAPCDVQQPRMDTLIAHRGEHALIVLADRAAAIDTYALEGRRSRRLRTRSVARSGRLWSFRLPANRLPAAIFFTVHFRERRWSGEADWISLVRRDH